GGQRREFGRTAAAGRADEGEHGRVRVGRERLELLCRVSPFHRFETLLRGRALLAHGGRRQFQDARRVQVGAVGGNGRRVLGDQVGQRAGEGRVERDREP